GQTGAGKQNSGRGQFRGLQRISAQKRGPIEFRRLGRYQFLLQPRTAGFWPLPAVTQPVARGAGWKLFGDGTVYPDRGDRPNNLVAVVGSPNPFNFGASRTQLSVEPVRRS